MAEVIFKKPQRRAADIKIPASKSISHRAVIAAALAGGAELHNIGENNDISATREAMCALLSAKENEQIVVDCCESGSTLRFLIPIAAALGVNAEFIGHGRLPERPIGTYEELLPNHGVSFSTSGGLPLEISGKLLAGDFGLRGDISSQFISGLLFALPLCEGDSRIILTTPLESESYVRLTIDTLAAFGIEIESIENGYAIKSKQKYIGADYTVEGDWSQAAFFLNIAALSGEEIRITGLREASLQGDRACVDLYRAFGVDIHWIDGALIAQNSNVLKPHAGLKATSVDASQIPDLVPALAICAAIAEGETRIYNAGRLRIKESDRLLAMKNAICALSGEVRISGDEIIIKGKDYLHGGTVNGENDHRILMAVASAAFRAKGEIAVSDAESVNKSYPDFYKDYEKAGGEYVINMG